VNDEEYIFHGAAAVIPGQEVALEKLDVGLRSFGSINQFREAPA
jgi:hypothetical protein